MTPGRLALHVLLVVSAGTVSRPVAAADPLGFYVGGAIGTAFTTCICGLASRGGEVRSEQTDIRFAFGAGAQVKLGAFSIRAEYERISASGGDPDLLSIGASWSF